MSKKILSICSTKQSEMMPEQDHNEIEFTLESGKVLSLLAASGVFIPTATTNILIQAVLKTISGKSRLLDLGCGTGIVGLALYLQGLVEGQVYASDLSSTAVSCSRKNFERYNCPAEVREGSLFEPWSGEKFNVIVDDISGVAEEVAKLSSWFDGIPCDTGADGIALVSEILRSASSYLSTGGYFFFPVLSLSNVDGLLKEANASFDKVELVSRQEWPLPEELQKHKLLLEDLEAKGMIKLSTRFGMTICYTEVYCARNF